VARVPGVQAVSPQVFLETLVGVACCAVPEMFMLAYDPATDFTLKPWLDRNLEGGLAVGEAIGGSYVFVPDGADNILIYGYGIKLAANIEPTGTGLDQSMFFTMDTARDIARVSIDRATQPMEIPTDAISSVMVKVDPAYDAHQVAAEIRRLVAGVVPVESTNLFATHRSRIAGLSQTLLALIAISWGLSVVLVGLLFSMVVNERKREIGVLRALGAGRLTVLASLLLEGMLLSLFGGMAGNGLSLLAISYLRANLMDWLGFPFLLPTSAAALPLVLIGLGVAAVTVFAAIILPATRISNMDPVAAMRN
jgi:putative ABC transport system permease protein